MLKVRNLEKLREGFLQERTDLYRICIGILGETSGAISSIIFHWTFEEEFQEDFSKKISPWVHSRVLFGISSRISPSVLSGIPLVMPTTTSRSSFCDFYRLFFKSITPAGFFQTFLMQYLQRFSQGLLQIFLGIYPKYSLELPLLKFLLKFV